MALCTVEVAACVPPDVSILVTTASFGLRCMCALPLLLFAKEWLLSLYLMYCVEEFYVVPITELLL